MSSPRFPPYPPFPSTIRLATASDIKRMAELSVLGFKDSEIFRYERPLYHKFPEDAVASFADIYHYQLQDPGSLVIVAEDQPVADEVSHSASDHEKTEDANASTKRVVVGVASWVLPEDSPRTGQFIDPDVYGNPLLPSLDQDLCQRRLKIFTEIKIAKEKKYFAGKMICDKLVVHPSYRRRHHATNLLRWGLRLCDQDGVDQGVMPAHMGEPVYLGLGYKVIDEIHIPDDGEVEGFSQRVVVYKAKDLEKREEAIKSLNSEEPIA